MTKRTPASDLAIPFPHELAISAVPYDAVLVAELSRSLEVRLFTPVVWSVVAGSDDLGQMVASRLSAERSRIVVILHQRLWGHDATTRRDDVALHERLAQRPDSVVVVTLDDHPLPAWLDEAPRCDLAANGVEGAAEFLVEAITANGGFLRRPPPTPEEHPEPPKQRTWPEGPSPFLSQPRAFSALRRELDALAAELKPADRPKGVRDDERTVELHALPNRLVLRLDDVGISFSWVSGRLGTVADGRLLVIQWVGAIPRARGVAALKFATPVRESVYRAESTGPDEWNWRADGPNGRACSTLNLAGEWLAGASLATAAALAARAES